MQISKKQGITAVAVLALFIFITAKGIAFFTPLQKRSKALISRDRIARHIRNLVRLSPVMLLNSGLDSRTSAPSWLIQFNSDNPNLELKDCLTNGGVYCKQGAAYPLTLFDQEGAVVAASKIKPASPAAPPGPWQYYDEDGTICTEPILKCPLVAQTFFVVNCVGPTGVHCTNDRVEIEIFYTVQSNPEYMPPDRSKYKPVQAVSNDQTLKVNGSNAFWATGSNWIPIMMAPIPGYYGTLR